MLFYILCYLVSVAGCIFAVIALVFSGSYLYDWLDHNQMWRRVRCPSCSCFVAVYAHRDKEKAGREFLNCSCCGYIGVRKVVYLYRIEHLFRWEGCWKEGLQEDISSLSLD
jgi:hypothetical protein